VRTTGAPNSAAPGADGARGAIASEGAAGIELPTAVPAFLEACAKLAADAAARGDVAGAREIIDKAARALRFEPT